MKAHKKGKLILVLAGILLLSSCDTNTYYKLPESDKYLSLCQKVIVEKNEEICILPDKVKLETAVTVFPAPKDIKIKNPKEFVKFTLPKRGYTCNSGLMNGCDETEADKKFWIWYLLDGEKPTPENLKRAKERLDKIKSIIEELNKGIERGEIPVQTHYNIEDGMGKIVFTITLPKKYVVLLKEYMEANIQIGVKANTPFGAGTTYYELTY